MTKSELKQLIRETINDYESTQPQKVVGKYIYFVDSKELYSLKPYKLVANRCDISVANNWKKATVMQGEDVRDTMGIKVSDTSAWYIVYTAPSDHAYTAYIGK